MKTYKKRRDLRDLMATNATLKSAQGERIFVTNKKESKVMIKWNITKIK